MITSRPKIRILNTMLDRTRQSHQVVMDLKVKVVAVKPHLSKPNISQNGMTDTIAIGLEEITLILLPFVLHKSPPYPVHMRQYVQMDLGVFQLEV